VLKIKTWNLEPFGCAQGSVWNPSAVLRATLGTRNMESGIWNLKSEI